MVNFVIGGKEKLEIVMENRNYEASACVNMSCLYDFM